MLSVFTFSPAQCSCEVVGSDHGTKIRIQLGTFRTAEMTAIAFGTAVFHLRGEISADRLNFPFYGSHIRSIVEGSSPSESAEKAAWKAAKSLTPLITSLRRNVSCHVWCYFRFNDFFFFFALQDSSFEVFISFQDSLTTHLGN
jgi:hypothetical protein